MSRGPSTFHNTTQNTGKNRGGSGRTATRGSPRPQRDPARSSTRFINHRQRRIRAHGLGDTPGTGRGCPRHGRHSRAAGAAGSGREALVDPIAVCPVGHGPERRRGVPQPPEHEAIVQPVALALPELHHLRLHDVRAPARDSRGSGGVLGGFWRGSGAVLGGFRVGSARCAHQ